MDKPKNLPILVALIFCLSLTLSVFAQVQLGSEVLAIVNGDTIYTEQLSTKLRRLHSGQENTQRSDFSIETLIDKLVNDRLLIQETRLLELDQDSTLLKRVSSYQTMASMSLLKAEAVPDTITIGDTEIAAFHKEQYRELHLKIMTIRGKELVDSLYNVINNGSNFEELAQQFSLDTYRYRGGDLGYIRWIDTENALKEQAGSMEIGDVSNPFDYREVYAIIKLYDTKPADPDQLDQLRKSIIRIMKYRKMQSATEDFYQRLRLKYPVIIDVDALQTLSEDPGSSNFTNGDLEIIVAQVGDSKISSGEFMRMLMRKGKFGAISKAADNGRELLEEYINERLLRMETISSGMLDDPRILKKTKSFQDSLSLSHYFDYVIASNIAVSQDEIDSVYQANKEEFRKPSNVHLSQITVETREEADELKQRLDEGANFSWLAKKYSIDDDAQEGGDIGRGTTDEFPGKIRQELEEIPIGQSVGPYKTSIGYIIMNVQDRTPGEIHEFSKVAPMLSQRLYKEKYDQNLNKIIAELKEDSEITINQEILDNLVIKGNRDQQQEAKGYH